MELPRRYPKDHYDQKATRYALAVRGIFDIKVDAVTTERWSDIISLSRAIDSYLDDGEPDSLEERTTDITSLFKNHAEIAKQFPSLSPAELGDGHSRLQILGESILNLNLEIKTTASLARYARLRRREGRQFAQLITDIVTSKIADHPNYPKFKHWLMKASEVRTLGNSLMDVHDDYQRGEIAVVPNCLSRPRLLGYMALSLVRDLPASGLHANKVAQETT